MALHAVVREPLVGALVGEPRRNSVDGTVVDLGRLVIRESTLSNGDKFLISLGNCTNAAEGQTRSRWRS